MHQWKGGCFNSPCADVVEGIFNDFSLPLQLLRHVLQILFVVSVGVVQELVAGQQEGSALNIAHGTTRQYVMNSADVNSAKLTCDPCV